MNARGVSLSWRRKLTGAARLRRFGRATISEESKSGGDSLWRIHLEWMYENQPDYIRELHQSGELYAHLDRYHQNALCLVERLENLGMERGQAWEVAIAELLAPADGPAMVTTRRNRSRGRSRKPFGERCSPTTEANCSERLD